MKKIALVLVSMFALTGCQARTDSQEQAADIARVQSALPAGCTLHYAGEVRVDGYREANPSRVFFTVCGDTVTTSETHSVQQGKATVNRNDITIVTK
jgi:hypothetical protein